MNSLITTGNDVSARIVDQLTTAAWQGGLALLIVWCICALWKNSSPRVRCWLWRIAFAKLLLALVWINPWQLPVLPAEPQTTIAQQDERNKPETADTAFGDNSKASSTWSAEKSANNDSMEEAVEGAHVWQDSSAFGAIAPARTSVISAMPASTMPAVAAKPSWFRCMSWQLWLTAAWAAGVVIGLLVLCKHHLVATKLRKRSQPASAEELSQLQTAITDRLTLARTPEVRYSADVQGPMLIGFWKPIVLLPSRWQSAKPEYLRMALTHEFAHVRRRDLLWNWLPAVGRIVFWFHPLVWMTSRHWSLDVEEACDELAVNDGRLPRLRYAEFLVWIVAPRHSGFAPMTLGAASPFSHLKRRLLTMKKRSDKPRRLWVAVAGCSLLGLGVLAPVQLTAQDAPPDPAQQSQDGGGQSGGGTVQSAGGGSGSATQQQSQSGGTVQTAGGGGGVVTQSQGSNQGGATVQTAGSGGGTVSQKQGSGQGGTVQTAGGGGGGGVVTQAQGSNQAGGGVVASSSSSNKGKTTVSIADDGKSISIEVEHADEKVNVKVTRKDGESTTVNRFSLDNLDELKDKDLEAYDVFKKHTQKPVGAIRAGQNVGGFGGGATSGFGGNTASFGQRQGGFGQSGGGAGTSGFGGRGGSASSGRGTGGLGGASGTGVSSGGLGGASGSGGQGGPGATAQFGRGAGGGNGSARFGRGAGVGSSAGEGQSGGTSAGTVSSGSGRGSNEKSAMQELLQQLMELRVKNADNPEVVRAIDDLVKQLGSEKKSSGR